MAEENATESEYRSLENNVKNREKWVNECRGIKKSLLIVLGHIRKKEIQILKRSKG